MINKNITTPDGRDLIAHLILDKEINMQTFTFTLKIGSWTQETLGNANAFSQDYYVELFNSEYSFDMLEEETLEARALEAEWKLIGSPPDLSLADLKEKKRRDIDNWRGTARYSTVIVPVNGQDYEWQADSNSQSLISDAVNFAVLEINDPPPVWRTMDNIDVVVTLNDLKLIAGAMAQKTSACFYKSFQLKALVETATTKAQVEAITWDTPT